MLFRLSTLGCLANASQVDYLSWLYIVSQIQEATLVKHIEVIIEI